ncbi:hypothetical protein LTR10_005665 [Elasticomyces elasticus]|nr:hypothetical protein LTR10_005665 [Elasticomyces elasticus]KAK4976404.1 hypothetical protein LTR42_004033 [Elasticomyces elasticus]
MATSTMPPSVALISFDGVGIMWIVFVSVAIYYVGKMAWLALFSPLASYPGPPLRAWTKIPAIYTTISGHDPEIFTALHRRYGPVVRIAPKELSFVSGSLAFQDIYGSRRPGQPKPFKPRNWYGKSSNGADSLITGDDTTHHRQRKILSNSFSDKALKEQEPLLKRWAEKMAMKLRSRATDGAEVDLLKIYNCTAFDMMGDLTFAEDLNMLEEGEYSSWVKAIFSGVKFGTFFRAALGYSTWTQKALEYWLQNSKFARRMEAEHWNYCKERVDRRLKKTPDRPDIWSKVLEMSQGTEALSLNEHHSNASLFMVAGTETIATALSGTTYHLLQNPGVLAKVTAEIRSAFRSVDDFRFEDLARQKYLMAVLHEGLRMYPPLPILVPREVPSSGMKIGDHWVPGGTVVGVHHYATYRSETHFRHANEFRPERWLGDPEFASDHLDTLEVFSVGPRNCLGQNLAWHEMRLLLATVLLNFDLELCEENDNWIEQRVFTLWEKKPLMCKLVPADA